MRSGLKHLLAYQLTQLNKPCYLISKRFVFRPIKSRHLPGFRVTGCIILEWPNAFTAYNKTTLILQHDTVRCDYDLDGFGYIYNNKYWTLEGEEKSKVMNLYNNHRFKELLDYRIDKNI